jgi:hypothetical protein
MYGDMVGELYKCLTYQGSAHGVTDLCNRFRKWDFMQYIVEIPCTILQEKGKDNKIKWEREIKMWRQVASRSLIGIMDLLGCSCTSGHRIAVVIFRNSKLERNGTVNRPICCTSLNDPTCHPFLSNPAMEASKLSSFPASFVVSVMSLLSSTVIFDRSNGKWGSSLNLQNVLNAIKIFSSIRLWSSLVKVSCSSDIQLSARVVEGLEEACRSPTDKCEKSLDIESMDCPWQESMPSPKIGSARSPDQFWQG